MDPRLASQRRGSIWLIGFMVLFIGIASGVVLATGLDWLPHSNAHSTMIGDDASKTRTSGPATVDPSDFLVNTQDSFREIVEAVRPAVVSIVAQGVQQQTSMQDPFEYFFDMPDPFGDRNPSPHREMEEIPSFSTGSGFIVDPEGYVLTNNHVVAGAIKVEVILDDGSRLDAEIIGTDPETDVAVLQISEEGDWPYLEFGDSDVLDVGDWVMAVGNPFGYLAGTVTVGIVSATNREYINLPGNTYYQDFIQTDAAINFGNSGGPLVDIHGRAVGINTAIASTGSGIGFAIPIDLAEFVYQSLVQNGEVVRGWIGVGIQNIDSDMASVLNLPDSNGAVITEVHPGNPAADAGLQAMDVILEVEGEDVTSSATATRLIAALPVGEESDMTIWRDGGEMTITIVPAEREPGGGLVSEISTDEDEDKPIISGPRFGIDVIDLDRWIIEDYGLPTGTQGVMISSVEIGSVAWEKGLTEGQVITEIDGTPVTSVDEYRDAVVLAHDEWESSGVPMFITYLNYSTSGWVTQFVAIPFD